MKFALSVSLLAVLALAGCSTFQGLKNDLSSGYESVAGIMAKPADPEEERKKQLPVYDGTCPEAGVRPDLAQLVEFTDPAKPSEDTKISDVTIRGIERTCRVENGGIVMQIDIALYGRTGAKARQKASDKPSFAYPYFVAVTDETGNVVSKEIFAASLAYAAEQKDIIQTESIFQAMPFPDAAAGKTYTVVVGLQLTPEQLSYNQQSAGGAAP